MNEEKNWVQDSIESTFDSIILIIHHSNVS